MGNQTFLLVPVDPHLDGMLVLLMCLELLVELVDRSFLPGQGFLLEEETRFPLKQGVFALL